MKWRSILFCTAFLFSLNSFSQVDRSTFAPFEELLIGKELNFEDDDFLTFGNDNDFKLFYDEAGDNRLEITDGSNLLGHWDDIGALGEYTSTHGLNAGINDTTNGDVIIYGGLTTLGSRLIMWTAGSEDSTYEFFLFETESDHLVLESDVTADAFKFFGTGDFTALGDITGAQFDSGNGLTEIFDMDQDIATTDAVVFLTVDTGQGANELFAMDQDVETGDAVVFLTLDTGQGANELYDMDQNVLVASSPTFVNLNLSGDLLVDGLNIGITADPDLITLAANTFTVNATGFGASRVIGTTAADFYLRATSDTDNQEIMRFRANSEKSVFATLTNAGALSLNNIISMSHVDGNVDFGFDIDITGAGTFGDDITSDEGHFISTQSTKPTIATGLAISDGSGDIASLDAGSTDSKGVIRLFSGDGTMIAGRMCIVTYDTAYASAPTVIFTKIGSPSTTAISLDVGLGDTTSTATQF